MIDGTYGSEGDTTLYETINPQPGGVSNHNPRLALDVVGQYSGVKNLVVNVQLDYGTEKHASATYSLPQPSTSSGVPNASWYGFSVQPVYKLNDKWSLGGRIEVLDDADGAITLVPNTDPGATTLADKVTLFTIAVAPSYQVSPHFLARAEARYDSCNKQVFANKDQVVNKKNQGEISFETLFSF